MTAGARRLLASAFFAVAALAAWSLMPVVADEAAAFAKLYARANALHEKKKYAEALEVRRSAVEAAEQAEIASNGKAGRQTAAAWHGVADAALFARRFEEANEAATRALSLSPDQFVLEVNRAHALLLAGREADARELYRNHKDRLVADSDTLWQEIVDADFERLADAGLAHPTIAEIRAELGVKPDLQRRAAKLATSGRYTEAMATIQRAMEKEKALHGEETSAFATSLSWKAYLEDRLDNVDSAAALFKRSAAIYEK